MISILHSLVLTLRDCFRGRAALQVEILALRHQLLVLQRSKRHRLRLNSADRLFWVGLLRLWNEWRSALLIVKPADVAGFAVVLLTPDDFGGPAGHPEKALPRARQNVVLEWGYFMGKLGRGRVCCLYVDGVELPSDYQGVLWLPYDDSGAWRDQLARELVAAGVAFDSQALAAAAKKTSDADINTLIHLGKMRSLKDLA